jgi:hypothetical protein
VLPTRADGDVVLAGEDVVSLLGLRDHGESEVRSVKHFGRIASPGKGVTTKANPAKAGDAKLRD